MASKRSALERLLQPAKGDLPLEYARKLLSLDFTDAEHARYRELSEKAQTGNLSDDERNELDDLLTANDVLTILHAKAHQSLNTTPSAA